MSYGIHIAVSGGVGGTINCSITNVGFDWNATSADGIGYTGFTGGATFTATPYLNYEFVEFKIYVDTANESYTSGFYAGSETSNPFSTGSGYVGSGTSFSVIAIFEYVGSSSGGDDSSSGAWTWGSRVAQLTGSNSGSYYLDTYEVDYLNFTSPVDGVCTFSVYSSNDLVIYGTKGSATFNDNTNPSALINWNYHNDYYAEDATESISFDVIADTLYELGWYEYYGKNSTVIWSVTFTPTQQYTLTYSANGGTGSVPESVTAIVGSNVAVDTTIIPTKTDYLFKGWAESSSATTPNYSSTYPGSVILEEDITLYAVWWPDFNWSIKNAEEANLLNEYVSIYISDTGNSELISNQSVYFKTWFDNLATILQVYSSDENNIITLEDLNALMNNYKNYGA